MPACALPSLVLLVEDHAVIAMNTEMLLLDLGVGEVKIAGSVDAAFALIEGALIEGARFDFAILDFHLGEGEDCLPIAERLVADGIPIAFATGVNENMALPAVFESAKLLSKPYSFEDLKRLFC